MAPLDQLTLPVIQLDEVSLVGALLNYPPVKALLPLPLLALIAPALWWFFRGTWNALDQERAAASLELLQSGAGIGRRTAASPAPVRWQRHWRKWGRHPQHAPRRRGLGALGARAEMPVRTDYRPAVCLVLVAIVLTLHEYFGGRSFYEGSIRPSLAAFGERHSWLKFKQYDELFGYSWWVFARVSGYVAPLFLWKLLFPRDSILDMGLRTRGFWQHIWIYVACLAIVIVAMLTLATQPEFLNYYPFYKKSSRSWFDFLAWQGMYWVQFLALELFFRGWMLAALRRTMGMGAIFVMVVPYCMIHYGKPYLEAHAAIVAGVVLGSLAMRTRSIYAGFLVHITVATLMDTMALTSRDALPESFWPPASGKA